MVKLRRRGAAREAKPEKSDDEKGRQISFGKKLAHTDKKVRDQGFRTLRTWLQENPELVRLDYLKLWKGLYFAMWMADKRPVQQELSVNMALLINDIPRPRREMWLSCFWEIVQAHWEKLDKHRMSKYQLFTRIVVAEAFKSLREGGWQDSEVRAVAAIFTGRVPRSADGINAPSTGLLLHLLRVLWDELSFQLDKEPKASKEALMLFLEPFCQLAEGSFLAALVKHVNEHVLLKAPAEIADAVLDRVLDGAAKASTPKANRQALYNTADSLEKRLRPPAAASALTLPSVEAGEATGAREGKLSRRERKRRRSAAEGDDGDAAPGADADAEDAPPAGETAEGCMSPFMLPKAAAPFKVPGVRRKAKTRSSKASSSPAKKRKGTPSGSGMVAKKRKKAA